eukprot:SAG31_NODE_22362_length_527_cov_1.044393_2_plen_54_part_01
MQRCTPSPAREESGCMTTSARARNAHRVASRLGARRRHLKDDTFSISALHLAIK